MSENTKLRFYQSYVIIDIWHEQDTKLGTEKFVFWFENKEHETDSAVKALNLAKALLNASRGRNKVKGS